MVVPGVRRRLVVEDRQGGRHAVLVVEDRVGPPAHDHAVEVQLKRALRLPLGVYRRGHRWLAHLSCWP